MEFTPYSPDMEFTDFGHPVFDCDFHFYERPTPSPATFPRSTQGWCGWRTSTGARR